MVSSVQPSRAPLINWEQQISNFLDSYSSVYKLLGVNEETALAHALQKDAVQNSIDAYNEKSPDEWSVIFELNTKEDFVSITDRGTYGLTGTSKLDAKILESLPFKEYENERWCRFESLGYKNPDPRARGARGQGKFIFIGASKRKEIVYETLRSDGVYRVGHWVTSRGDKQLIEPLEDDSGREYLSSKVHGVRPLTKVGTRIIILEPEEWLKKSFLPLLKCDLARYISETWWELLLDEKFKIYVKLNQDIRRVLPPKLYKEFLDNPEKFLYTYIKNKDVGFRNGKLRGAKIKDLVIAYSEQEIPEEMQGIAVQRNKMKVFSFDITQGNDFIDPKYKKHIFGWVIFDEATEEELKKYEDAVHYSFSKPKGTLPQFLFGTSGWLSKQVRKFAEEKLGLKPHEKVLEEYKEVESKVLSILNLLAQSFGYQKGKRKVEGEGRGPSSPIRIQLFPLVFPGSTRRVNFGESVGVTARVVYDTDRNLKVKFEITLEGPPSSITPRRETIVEDEMILPSSTNSKNYGPYSIFFSKNKHIPGRYTLKCVLVGVEGDIKGQILHKITRAIYVEVEPPAFGGMFRSLQPAEFPESLKKLVFKTDEEDNGLVVYYNIKHPLYLRTMKLREALSQRNKMAIDPVFDYLLKIGIMALVTEDFKSECLFLKHQPTLRNKITEFLQRDSEGILEKILESKEKLWQELLFDKLLMS